ncbi:hypothetical protein FRB97_005417, partial [Tulasnella sp. 331]
LKDLNKCTIKAFISRTCHVGFTGARVAGISGRVSATNTPMETKIMSHEVRLRRHPEPTPRWMANVDEDEMAMVKRGVDIVIRVMKRSAEEDDA